MDAFRNVNADRPEMRNLLSKPSLKVRLLLARDIKLPHPVGQGSSLVYEGCCMLHLDKRSYWEPSDHIELKNMQCTSNP